MNFDFELNGDEGPIMLLLPGSYSHSVAWRGIISCLEGNYRTVATSLPGYGGSQERRQDNVSGMKEMVEFVSDVSRKLGEPFHLVGHSFGGLTALATTIAEPLPVLSLVTFEGNPILTDMGRVCGWQTVLDDVYDQFENAVLSGNPDAAGIVINYWSKPGVFESLPEPVKEYCRSTAYTNLLDWRSAMGFNPVLSDYGLITVPTTIVRGEHANRAMIELCDGIVDHVPKAQLEVVPGSNHFLISTHPAECAAIIDRHMAGLN